MIQIPSQDWPRRSTPLLGTEDLLKQNPVGDISPQEERIPSSLIGDYIIDRINISNVGTGVNLFYGKFGDDFRFNTIESLSSRLNLNLNLNTIQLDVNAIEVAHSMSLTDIGDILDTPNVNEFLQWNGAGWVTSPMLSEFTISDGLNDQILDGTNNVLTFEPTANISFSVSATNKVSATWSAAFANLSDISAPSGSDLAFTFDGTNYVWTPFTDISGISVTDALNIGTLGFGVFTDKVGTILRFKNIVSNSSKLNVSLSANNITLDVDSTEVASEINLSDIGNVSGTPITGDILVFSGSTWITTSSTGSGFGVGVKDQTNVLNNFNTSTPIKIYGASGITTSFVNATDLRVGLSANLNDLSDVTINSPSNLQTILLSGSTWINSDIKFNVVGNVGSQIVKNFDTLRLLGQQGITVEMANARTALIVLDASITDLNDIPSPTASGQTIYYNGSGYTWQTFTGESNSGANVGTLGYGVYKNKTGTVLNFKKIASNSSKIDLSIDGNDNILIDANPIEIADEITLKDLLDVTNSPDINGYLQWNGISWVTNATIGNFDLEVKADTGINLLFGYGDTHTISGDNQYLYTENYLSGSTQQTKVKLNLNVVANDIDLEDLGNIFGNPAPNDTIFYNGTNFVFQPLPTITYSNAWLLGGNNETSEYSFGTLNDFDIPIKANNIQVGIIKTDGKFGWGVSNPTSTIDVSGSAAIGNIISTSINYTATDDDYFITVNAGASNKIITLPLASLCEKREYVIKKIDNSSNTVTITSLSDIDGASTYVIYTQYVSIKVKSDGTTWHIF